MKTGMPLISIMIPVYNGANTIPFTIHSLLLQSYQNWKCFIVNDGSTDGTAAYLDSLEDERFQVIHLKENKGRPYARQVILDAAVGKYLAFLDADDLYHPLKLEKQVQILENCPEVLITCCGNASYNDVYVLKTVRGKGKGKPTKYRIGDRQNVVLRTAMVRLEEAKKCKFNLKLNMAEDNDFTGRLLHDRYFLTTGETLYYYSEFVSVTGRKVLASYYYDVIYHFGLLKYGVWTNLKSVFLTAAKFVVTAVLLPFKGVEFFLRKRGVLPDALEIAEFEQLKKALNLIPTKYE